MDGEAAILEAARLARLRIELPEREEQLWREAYTAGMSYAQISLKIALELQRQGVPIDAIAETGTGANNIRKRLRAAG